METLGECKWLSDDFTETCTNEDCPICFEFCPLGNYPVVCKYYEEKLIITTASPASRGLYTKEGT